jgi:hypothetical protein
MTSFTALLQLFSEISLSKSMEQNHEQAIADQPIT